jgi:predicted transcriptional regulator YheO
MNFNIAVFEEARLILERFTTGARVLPQHAEFFKDDWQERINSFLYGWLSDRQLSLNSLSREHRRILIEALHTEGAFKGKSAADYVAKVLGISRATVFKHLKEVRQ